MGLLEIDSDHEMQASLKEAQAPAARAAVAPARQGRSTLFASSASDAAARVFPDWLEDVKAWPQDRHDARAEEKLPLGVRMLVLLGLAIAAWIPVFALAALL